MNLFEAINSKFDKLEENSKELDSEKRLGEIIQESFFNEDEDNKALNESLREDVEDDMEDDEYFLENVFDIQKELIPQLKPVIDELCELEDDDEIDTYIEENIIYADNDALGDAITVITACDYLNKDYKSAKELVYNDDYDFFKLVFDDGYEHYFYNRGIFGQGIKDAGTSGDDFGPVLTFDSTLLFDLCDMNESLKESTAENILDGSKDYTGKPFSDFLQDIDHRSRLWVEYKDYPGEVKGFGGMAHSVSWNFANCPIVSIEVLEDDRFNDFKVVIDASNAPRSINENLNMRKSNLTESKATGKYVGTLTLDYDSQDDMYADGEKLEKAGYTIDYYPGVYNSTIKIYIQNDNFLPLEDKIFAQLGLNENKD